jgi:hypothetical protein
MLVERERKVRRLQSQQAFATPRDVEERAYLASADNATCPRSGSANKASVTLLGPYPDTVVMSARGDF